MHETTEIAKETLKKANQNGVAKENAILKIEQIRSDEVQEIITAVPNWMIRWGITLIFGLILMLITLSWFIKYPDIIVGKAVLTTINPPVKLVVKSSGKLTNILFEDGSTVKKNQTIAEMESPITKDGIAFLNKYILEIRDYLNSGKEEFTMINENHIFGAMQSTFNDLQKNLKDLQELKQNNFSIQKINNLKSKIIRYKKLIAISSRQFSLLKDELKNAEEKYKADQQLYEKGYTAKMEFYKEETLFRQKQMDFENLKKTTTEQEITLINLQQELNDTEFQYQENKRILTNKIQGNLLEIENGIKNWQQNYSFITPVSGKLVWLEKIHPNQFIEAGKSLFAITTNNEKYIVLATIPATGFGKIKTGQTARIKLDNYPSYEFGHLEATVTKITEIPNKNSYQVEMTLQNGMTSSYNKLLTFTPEMAGTVEIVTDNLRVMQRIFNQFNKLFERNINSNASVSSTLSK